MEWMYLLIATFFASVVQSATGFGFALIAVPFFLIVLNSSDAIQIVIIVTLAISIIHWLKLRDSTPIHLMKWLIVGGSLGFPVGVLIYMYLALDALKLLIALLIILISLQNGWYLFRRPQVTHSFESLSLKSATLGGVGVISGLMATCMAMPGPPLMLYLSRTALDKNQIRAAMFAFFIFSYTGALIMQSIFIGIKQNTWQTAGLLIPAAIFGLIAGELLSKKIPEDSFRVLVVVILVLTGCVMLFNT